MSKGPDYPSSCPCVYPSLCDSSSSDVVMTPSNTGGAN